MIWEVPTWVLQILEREKAVFMEDKNMQPDLQGSEYVLERQLKPEARKDIVEMFKKMDSKTNIYDRYFRRLCLRS